MPSSKASCETFVAVLGTDVEVPQGMRQQPSRDMGSRLGSGGFAGICAAVTLHVSCDNFCVPVIWVLGSQDLCHTGGNEEVEVE